MLGDDAERGLDEEGGGGLRKAKQDRARIDDERLDLRPTGRELRRPGKVVRLKQREGERDVMRVEGLAVVPEDAVAEVERVGAAVRGDLPALGEVGERGAVRAEPRQPVEDERGEVSVDGVAAGEQRVDPPRDADDAVDVAVAR